VFPFTKRKRLITAVTVMPWLLDDGIQDPVMGFCLLSIFNVSGCTLNAP
jgi:hypothetical protein